MLAAENCISFYEGWQKEQRKEAPCSHARAEMVPAVVFWAADKSYYSINIL